MFEFMANSDFTRNGVMPVLKPEVEMLDLPSGRKRKHDGVFSSPSRPPSPTNSANLPEVKAVTIPGPPQKRPKSEDGPEETIAPVKAEEKEEKATQGRGSRSEPYTQFELCCIYIARKIRMLDWDTISWSLSRFRTPTVAMLAEARTAFDQYHENIVEMLRLCCWPEDSMYLIAIAADECLAAIERGSWSEELKQFKNNRGHLHQIHMQRRIERLYKKTMETPDEKRSRRRRERKFGYEWLSIEEFGRIPLRKRVGAMASAESNKPRKRRTREQIQQEAAEKAAARALLKANGIKANGETRSRAKKADKAEQKPKSSPQIPPPPVPEDEEMKKASKSKKQRRKYDIPEQERLALPESHEESKRMSYSLTPEEREFSNRLKSGIEVGDLAFRPQIDYKHGTRTPDDRNRHEHPFDHFPRSEPKYETWRDRDILNTNRSPMQHYNPFAHPEPRLPIHSPGRVYDSVRGAPHSPSQYPSINNLLHGTTPPETKETPRQRLSLSSLLN